MTPRLLRAARPPLWLGVVVAALGVALTTLLLYPLDNAAPVLSLGVVYMLIVLVVASLWGLWLGAATALASALAFNFFHIPPTGRFTIAEGENWVGLVVFLAAALLASSVSQVARARAEEAEQRRLEADLAAEMARLLLRGGAAAGEPAGRRPAARELARAAERGDRAGRRRARRRARSRSRCASTAARRHAAAAGRHARGRAAARAGARRAGARGAAGGGARARPRCRPRWSRPRRCAASDVIKTALLRAVSHDLRSPLTAIMTAAEALRSPRLTARGAARSSRPTSPRRRRGCRG